MRFGHFAADQHGRSYGRYGELADMPLWLHFGRDWHIAADSHVRLFGTYWELNRRAVDLV